MSSSTSSVRVPPLRLRVIIVPRAAAAAERLLYGRACAACICGSQGAPSAAAADPLQCAAAADNSRESHPLSQTDDSSSNSAPVTTEVVIVGAGPCGLFQVFELGLLGIGAHVVDSLRHPGGQCAELYPDKPIYDIPALPVCGAQELVDRLLQQIKPFKAPLHLGHEVVEFMQRVDGRFHLATAGGVRFDAGAVVIAAGLGSFQPRRIGLEGAEAFEGGAIQYRVRNAAELAGKHLVLFGGGDSALDWTLELLPRAASLALVHRRSEFRAAPASVARMRALAEAGRMRYCEAVPQSLIVEGGTLRGVNIRAADGAITALNADQLLVFFGLHPKLGPIAEWGLALEKKALKVDPEKFQTSVPGVFAVGDINTYPGKKKLILSGFHEAALAAFAIQHHLYPQKKQFLQYTTTSPVMHQRLGVPD
ncbi:MAG: NAD(P)/FAD-dependent oxidoreductase [Gammaproteobacteria bacterium]|nr:NAD(P)/FAD-dependent oxidoreductase [Gammaproteobacteria bacterium]